MKLLSVALLGAFAASAQTPTFEAASIKPNRSGDAFSSVHRARGQISIENCSLRKLTLMAYGIPDDREYALSGPDWLGNDRYNIVARYPGDTSQTALQKMLQNLLAERFHLTLHPETRQLPAYALIVAKGGAKIQPAEPGGGGDTSSRPGRLEATKITMQKLANLFSRFIGQPVSDETGLKGVYTFKLEWAPDETMRMGSDGAAGAPSTGPSIFAALQEQLGLKLEGRKGPVEVLVVDHIDRTPTEN